MGRKKSGVSAADLKKEITALKKQITKLESEHINLNEKDSSIDIHQTIYLHETVYQWLNQHSKAKMKEVLDEAIRIGLLAKMNAKVSQTLKMFQGEINSDLELIRTYMEQLEYKFRKDSEFKTNLEEYVSNQLTMYADKKGYADQFTETGASTDGSRDKKGDILVTIHEGSEIANLAIEIKFASAFSIGDHRTTTKPNLRADPKTQVYSEVLGARKTRNSRFCIFVIDKELNPIELQGDMIRFLPEVNGFIVQIDFERGYFEPLFVCYDIVRLMTVSSQPLVKFDLGLFSCLLRDLKETMARQKHIKDVGTNILNTIHDNHKKTVTSVSESIELFEGELAATRKVIDEMERLLVEFFTNGTLGAGEHWDAYKKTIENPKYVDAKNEAKAWMKAINDRRKRELEAHLDTMKDAKTVEDTSSKETKEVKVKALTKQQLKKMDKKELVEICIQLNVAKSGTKDVLMKRIIDAQATSSD